MKTLILILLITVSIPAHAVQATLAQCIKVGATYTGIYRTRGGKMYPRQFTTVCPDKIKVKL